MDNSEYFIRDLCAWLARDPLLVQATGGNCSWKHGNNLFIKASGTRISRKPEDNIFVSVSMQYLSDRINQRIYDLPISNFEGGTLRPSLEVMMHALLPHKYVVHFHSVDALSELVCENAEIYFSETLGNKFKWKLYDYATPGPELAKLINENSEKLYELEILLLTNHGVVFASDNEDALEKNIKMFLQLTKKQTFNKSDISVEKIKELDCQTLTNHYTVIEDKKIQDCWREKEGQQKILKYWALYPDHIVFFGSKPFILNNKNELKDIGKIRTETPLLIFVKNVGVYKSKQFNNLHLEQLRCFFEVIARIADTSLIKVLNESKVKKLKNWDAEKYRKAKIEQY